MFARMLQQNLGFGPIHEAAKSLITHYKEPVTSSLALAQSLRVRVRALYSMRQYIVTCHDLEKAKIEAVTLYHVLPKHMKEAIKKGKDVANSKVVEHASALAQHPTAETATFLFQYADLLKESGTVRTQEDFDRYEVHCKNLKQFADEIGSGCDPKKREIFLSHAYELLLEFHLLTLNNVKFENVKVLGSEYPRMVDRVNVAVKDKYLCTTHSPETIYLINRVNDKPKWDLEDVNGSTAASQTVCNLYNDFMENVAAREFSYSFLHAMLQKQQTLLTAPERQTFEQDQGTVYNPEAFARLTARPFLTQRQVAEKIQNEIYPLYTIKRDVQSSFALPIKQKAGPQKKKSKRDKFVLPPQAKEKEVTASAAQLPAKASDPAVEKPESELTRILANRSVKNIRYLDRVQTRLNKAAVSGAQREDTWAHGATLLLDQFVGAEDYCFTFFDKETRVTHHCFIVMVKDEDHPNDPPMTYIATYSMRADGACFHRCLQKKSLFEIFNAAAKDQVMDLIEWPALTAADATEVVHIGGGASSSEQMQYNSHTRIATLRDKKHRLTLQVLPRKKK